MGLLRVFFAAAPWRHERHDVTGTKDSRATDIFKFCTLMGPTSAKPKEVAYQVPGPVLSEQCLQNGTLLPLSISYSYIVLARSHTLNPKVYD